MKQPYLSIGRLERRLSGGGKEELIFKAGVNLLVGRSSTGKTKWLQTLDYLLAEDGPNPFEDIDEDGLSEKYSSAGVELIISGETKWIERRWREKGSTSKIFVDGVKMAPREFQHYLMHELSIPILNFPKGNPMSGQTWPELSFRMLLRHIYLQQRFWGGLTVQQPEKEQLACIMLFLGIAEKIYTEDYDDLIKSKLKVEGLKTRRENYKQSLNEVAQDLLSESGSSVSADEETINLAKDKLSNEIEVLRISRLVLIEGARDKAISSESKGRIELLTKRRVEYLRHIENNQNNLSLIEERLKELDRYYNEVFNEIGRLERAEDAGDVLADIKISHCPACDQSVFKTYSNAHECFLCHQALPDEVQIEGLGKVRIKFEQDRLGGELKESEDILAILRKDKIKILLYNSELQEQLAMIENELVPAREIIASLVQEEISSIDMSLGELNERQRQLNRISGASEIGQQLTNRIADIEEKIVPLDRKVKISLLEVDFDSRAKLLEKGINEYLNQINLLKPGIWQHSQVSVIITRSGFDLKVGKKRWSKALGGTDALYFFMAYHFGLLSLSDKEGCHYPGLVIIDVPGEFSGEAVEDKEDFIVQPFIDLLNQPNYREAQLIITGVSFTGLSHVNRLFQDNVYKS